VARPCAPYNLANTHRHHKQNLDSERSRTYLTDFKTRLIKTFKKTVVKSNTMCKLRLLTTGLDVLLTTSAEDLKDVEELRRLQDTLISELCSSIESGSGIGKDSEALPGALMMFDSSVISRNGKIFGP